MAILIQAAVYGTLTKGKDVTSIVQEIVSQGNNDILVNNNVMGGDPDFGVQKRFAVLYASPHGELCARACLEGETIDLV